MKSKKHIIALIFFGCIFLTANASNYLNLEPQNSNGVDLTKVRVPDNG